MTNTPHPELNSTPETPLPAQGKKRILAVAIVLIVLAGAVSGGAYLWKSWQGAEQANDGQSANNAAVPAGEGGAGERLTPSVSQVPDEDRDGLSDEMEKQLGTDPKRVDTDGDGLTDRDETAYQTDPKKPDTDGDGFSDGSEVEKGFNPRGEGPLLDLKREIDRLNSNQ